MLGPAAAPPPEKPSELSPEEEARILENIDRIQQEKQAALRNPGPTWRQWFFHDHLKWWVGLGFLIVDVWILTVWVGNDTFTSVSILGALGSLAAALYFEILVYRYLWRRPSEGELLEGSRFRPSWKALREVGRWTPEAMEARSRHASRPYADGSVDPNEFL